MFLEGVVVRLGMCLVFWGVCCGLCLLCLFCEFVEFRFLGCMGVFRAFVVVLGCLWGFGVLLVYRGLWVLICLCFLLLCLYCSHCWRCKHDCVFIVSIVDL